MGGGVNGLAPRKPPSIPPPTALIYGMEGIVAASSATIGNAALAVAMLGAALFYVLIEGSYLRQAERKASSKPAEERVQLTTDGLWGSVGDDGEA